MELQGLNKFGNPFGQKTGNTDQISGDGFGNMVKNFIDDVKNDQNTAKELTEDFIHGGDVEIHDVMIAGEKAKTSLDLLMQIRNKTLDMYKELNRMQI